MAMGIDENLRRIYENYKRIHLIREILGEKMQ